MDYITKYLKYKNKYLRLKKNQIGSGPESHRKLDKRLLRCIGTFETREEREQREESEQREKKQIEPKNGYKIYESVDEIMENNYSFDQSYELTEKQIIERFRYIESVARNLNETFGSLYSSLPTIIEGSKLMYIDARGDGNCFLNSLFIFTLMSDKASKINELYSNIEIRESEPINFDNFKRVILDLSDKLIDANLSGLDAETIVELKEQSRDPNIPHTQSFAQVYADNFNVKIIVVQVNKDFKFTDIVGRFEPSEENQTTDYLVIIQKENIHFGLLIPYKPMIINDSADLERELLTGKFMRSIIYEHFVRGIR